MKNRSPILLVGNVRSGTSILQNMLALDSDNVPWFEPRTIWAYADPARAHDRFTAEDASPRVRKYIRRRFARFQEENNGRRIIEKTPSNVLRIPYIHRIFPDSPIVYIIRDPLDQLSSSEIQWHGLIRRSKLISRIKETPKLQLPYYFGRYMRDFTRKKILRKKYVSSWGVRYPGIRQDIRSMSLTKVMAKQWVKCSVQADQDLADLPSEVWTSTRYEDLLENPMSELERISEHCGIELSVKARSTIESKIDPSRRGRWRRIEKDKILECLPILRSEMTRKGYRPPTDQDIAAVGTEERLEAERSSRNTTRGRSGI